MLVLVSGMTFRMSIWLMNPSPLHRWHAPWGELNEKRFGAGSLYAMPVVGHISRLEKYLTVSVSFSRIMISPSPAFIAVATLFLSLSLSFSLTGSLSITISMSWFLYLSTFMPVVISVTTPSTLALRYPFFLMLSNSSR